VLSLIISSGMISEVGASERSQHQTCRLSSCHSLAGDSDGDQVFYRKALETLWLRENLGDSISQKASPYPLTVRICFML